MIRDLKQIKDLLQSKEMKLSSDELLMYRDNKEVVLCAVSVDGSAINVVSEELKNDFDVALASVKKNGFTILELSEDMRERREVAFAAVNKHEMVYKYLSNKVKEDDKITLTAIDRNPVLLRYAPNKFKLDRDLVLKSVFAFVDNVPLIKFGEKEKQFKNEEIGFPQFFKFLMKLSVDVLEIAPSELLDNQKFMEKSLELTAGESFRFASERLRGDYSLIYAAAKYNYNNVFNASDKVKEENPDFFMKWDASKEEVNSFLLNKITEINVFEKRTSIQKAKLKI